MNRSSGYEMTPLTLIRLSKENINGTDFGERDVQTAFQMSPFVETAMIIQNEDENVSFELSLRLHLYMQNIALVTFTCYKRDEEAYYGQCFFLFFVEILYSLLFYRGCT
jgi:hypothetical protein